MDVLSYSAFNRQRQLNSEIGQKNTCIIQKDNQIQTLQVNASSNAASTCWLRCIEPCLLREPFQTQYWEQIPRLTGPAVQGFAVCDTSNVKRCNACCAWTVPAGATCARFQLWGAGGGSGGPGLCCGGSPFGATGAYASVTIPVTPGCVYTLCSGCALNCYSNCTAFGRGPGCPSFVTGFGLCNFCADGGQGSLSDWMAALGQTRTFMLTSSAVQCTTNYGPCICTSGTYFCFNSSTTQGEIPHTPGASYYGTTTSETSPSIVYGIRGMWPTLEVGYSNNPFTGCVYTVRSCHPPIYGFENRSRCVYEFMNNCCTFFGGCSVGNAQLGYLPIPGAGGYPTAVSGGFNSTAVGDAGRFGMVCVSFC